MRSLFMIAPIIIFFQKAREAQTHPELHSIPPDSNAKGGASELDTEFNHINGKYYFHRDFYRYVRKA